MTITLDTTTTLLLIGCLPVVYLMWYLIAGVFVFLADGLDAKVTFKVGGPFILLVAGMFGCLLVGVYRTIT